MSSYTAGEDKLLPPGPSLIHAWLLDKPSGDYWKFPVQKYLQTWLRMAHCKGHPKLNWDASSKSLGPAMLSYVILFSEVQNRYFEVCPL